MSKPENLSTLITDMSQNMNRSDVIVCSEWRTFDRIPILVHARADMVHARTDMDHARADMVHARADIVFCT